jgi:glycosyltransferase involved in cell wall biosynthesis
MSLPLVTIGCAVYNGEATLARALTPLVEQDYPNIEILISDDCSTDSSPRIYEEFAKKSPRVRIIRHPKNIGITENFNFLVREARGKYFMWADQDDIRDRTFVSKTVPKLEEDPEVVLCHSQTGVFVADPDDVKYIIKLFGVNGVRSRPLRYLKFLRFCTDTTVYGLMRTDVLKTTKIYRRDLGSANALLFELLLRGTFVEVPEVLYFYSARGMRNRPDPKEEYARVHPGKEMPRLYFPFIALAKNQVSDIRHSSVPLLEKLELASFVWGHASLIAATKLVYRSLAIPFDLPESFSKVCDDIVDPKEHLEFLNNSDDDEQMFPKYWILKGGD